MQERSSRTSSRDRRGTSSRSGGYSSQRSQRRNSQALGSSSRRRSQSSVGSNRSVSSSTRRLRSDNQDRDRNARRMRGERNRVPQGGYELRNRNINFAGKRSTYNPQLILVGGIAVAIIVLLIFFIVSCAASCESEEVNPTANLSESLQGELRTSMEKLVTQDYQSTYVAEHADLYPQDLLQLMINEPASTEFVFNYPTASHEAQAYEDPVSAGEVPLLYTWDARWGYVDYAGSSLAVTGSGPTALAMARMGLLGNAEMTPATIASQVTQLGGANGATFMAATLFGDPNASSKSSSSDSVTDENEDGYDDITGAYVGDSATTSEDTSSSSSTSASKLYSALGLDGEMITVEPGTSITDTLAQAIEDASYVLVETTAGPFGTTPHWCLIVGANDDGSLTVYDPTSVANSLHPWDPGSVIDGSSTLVALNTPQTESQKSANENDADGDGYDDETGEYVGSSSSDSSSNTSGTSGTTSGTSTGSSGTSGSSGSADTSTSSGTSGGSASSTTSGTSGTSDTTSSGTGGTGGTGTSTSSGASTTTGTTGSSTNASSSAGSGTNA